LLETVPLGSFNSLFSFTGSWKNDAAATKALAIDGYSLPLFRAIIKSDELTLLESVKRAIPNVWDPSALARSVALLRITEHILLPLLRLVVRMRYTLSSIHRPNCQSWNSKIM
jgi:hypothetical protein